MLRPSLLSLSVSVEAGRPSVYLRPVLLAVDFDKHRREIELSHDHSPHISFSRPSVVVALLSDANFDGLDSFYLLHKVCPETVLVSR